MAESVSPHRMSSSAVVIGAVGALSMAVAGCSSDDTVTAYCVNDDTKKSDGSYKVANEDNCDDDGSTHGGYHYYYGGTPKSGRVKGGSTTRPSDVKIVTERGATIQRGGAGGRGGSGARGG